MAEPLFFGCRQGLKGVLGRDEIEVGGVEFDGLGGLCGHAIADGEHAGGDEHDELGLDGLAVVHGGVGEVVGNGEERDKEHEWSERVAVVASPGDESAEEEERERGAEGDVGNVEGLALEV